MAKRALAVFAAATAAFVLLNGALLLSNHPMAARAKTYDIDKATSAQRLIGELPTKTQVMTTAVLLHALAIEPEENLASLAESRDYYRRVLRDFRYGNSELGLVKATDHEFLESLAGVEHLWAPFDVVVERILVSGQATPGDVTELARLNEILLEVSEEIVESFEETYIRGATSSILLPITETAERQTLLIQKMAKEFFLVAYGHDVAANREKLSETIADFDNVLAGLILGDRSVRVGGRDVKMLSAPTGKINAQLLRVRQMWGEFMPIVRSTAQGATPSERDIASLVDLIEPFYELMKSAADMYEDL